VGTLVQIVAVSGLFNARCNCLNCLIEITMFARHVPMVIAAWSSVVPQAQARLTSKFGILWLVLFSYNLVQHRLYITYRSSKVLDARLGCYDTSSVHCIYASLCSLRHSGWIWSFHAYHTFSKLCTPHCLNWCCGGATPTTSVTVELPIGALIILSVNVRGILVLLYG
jgi:hypothetical protein